MRATVNSIEVHFAYFVGEFGWMASLSIALSGSLPPKVKKLFADSQHQVGSISSENEDMREKVVKRAIFYGVNAPK